MRGNGPCDSHAWSKLGGSCQPHKGMGSGRWTKGLQGFFRKFFAFCYSPEQVCISSSSSTKLRKPPKLPPAPPLPTRSIPLPRLHLLAGSASSQTAVPCSASPSLLCACCSQGLQPRKQKGRAGTSAGNSSETDVHSCAKLRR